MPPVALLYTALGSTEHWFGRAKIPMRELRAQAPKSDELLDGLMRIMIDATKGVVVDDLKVRRIEKEAEFLIRHDASGGHMVLGAAGAVRGNLEATHHHFRVALQHARNPLPMYNYSIALGYLEDNQAALAMAEQVVEQDPGNKEWIDHAIACAMESANFERARELCDQWGKLNPDEEHHLRDHVSRVTEATKGGRLDHDYIRALMETADTVQRDSRVFTIEISVTHDDDGLFEHRRFVAATSKQTLAMNERLADNMAHTSMDLEPNYVFVFTGRLV